MVVLLVLVFLTLDVLEQATKECHRILDCLICCAISSEPNVVTAYYVASCYRDVHAATDERRNGWQGTCCPHLPPQLKDHDCNSLGTG
jgi:hypothetical protein